MGSGEHRLNLAEILSQRYDVQEQSENIHGVYKNLEPEKNIHCSQESEMPLEELLALYGYEVSDPIPEHNNEDTVLPHSLPDMTLDKEQIAKDLLSGEEEEETQSSADDLTPSVTSHDASDLFTHPLRSNSIADDDKETSSNSSEDDSEDDSIFSSDGRKDIMVGPQYQALIPPLNQHRYQERACENEDQLLWDPHVLPEKEVEQFLLRVEKRGREEANWEMLPDGALVRDNEQGLYELVKCSFNVEEALRRLRFNVKVIRDELCAWSEEECRNFEHGYRVHGKNFHLIQANKVRTRSVGECVEYYYMWKKSDRHDYFTQQSKFGRRKYSLPPGAMDYVDQDIDSGDVDSASHAQSSPALQSTTSAQDSQFDQDALDLEGTEEDSLKYTSYSQGRPSRRQHVHIHLNRDFTSNNNNTEVHADVESRESLSFSIGNNVDASNPEFDFGQIPPSASGGSCLYGGSVPSFHHDGGEPTFSSHCWGDGPTVHLPGNGFYELQLDPFLRSKQDVSSSMGPNMLKVGLTLPKSFSDELSITPTAGVGGGDTSMLPELASPVPPASAQMSVSVTADFGTISVSSFLSTHAMRSPNTMQQS